MFVWLIFGCCLCFHGIVLADRRPENANEVAEMDKTEVSNPILRPQPQQAFLGWDKRFPYELDDSVSAAAAVDDDDTMDESQLEKRAGFNRNPYSWMNRVDSKRNKRSRNPYAWLSLEENRSLQDSVNPLSYGWFKTMDKKSRNPYSWMAAPKRARNPYSWMNFI